LADFIVLDRNVLTIPADEIAKSKVLQTVVGGRIVYSEMDEACARTTVQGFTTNGPSRDGLPTSRELEALKSAG
jgi:hypothetical protein